VIGNENDSSNPRRFGVSLLSHSITDRRQGRTSGASAVIGNENDPPRTTTFRPIFGSSFAFGPPGGRSLPCVTDALGQGRTSGASVVIGNENDSSNPRRFGVSLLSHSHSDRPEVGPCMCVRAHCQRNFLFAMRLHPAMVRALRCFDIQKPMTFWSLALAMPA
jgi:hypothetical protein